MSYSKFFKIHGQGEQLYVNHNLDGLHPYLAPLNKSAADELIAQPAAITVQTLPARERPSLEQLIALVIEGR